MERREHIKQRVCSYLSDPNNQQFEWGRKDCALFANDMLVEVFDFEDIGRKFRGKYSNRFGAWKTIKAEGYLDIEDIPDTHLDVVTQAEMGDIAIKDGALGIVTGVYAYFLQLSGGLVKTPVRECEKFWRCVCLR